MSGPFVSYRPRSESAPGPLEQVESSSYWAPGIDYDSVTVPDAAPPGYFVSPFDGPEPFDDNTGD